LLQVEGGQLAKGLVEGLHVEGFPGVGLNGFVQFDSGLLTAAFLGAVRPGMIDEYPAHHGGRDGDKVSSVMPTKIVLVRQPKKRFVYQRGRLERMVGTLSAERALREGV
jgi:hypothetical protein